MRNIDKILLKKAAGFTVKEKVTEYLIEEDGAKKAVKEKLQTKYIPPDVSALKVYLELSGQSSDIEKMTDEELEREKRRLIESMINEKSGQS